MLYIKEGTFDIDPSTKVVKAEDYSAYLKAQEIIDLANQKAAGIEEDARKAFEEEKKRGYEEGMEEGSQKMSELMIESIAKSVQNFEDFENDVIQVVDDAIRKILGELDDKELIGRIVRNALGMVRDQKRVTVIVNPSELDTVRPQLSDLLAQYPSINVIDITSDPRVKAGGCKLETEMGVVDASLDTQLDAIKKSLTKVIK